MYACSKRRGGIYSPMHTRCIHRHERINKLNYCKRVIRFCRKKSEPKFLTLSFCFTFFLSFLWFLFHLASVFKDYFRGKPIFVILK